ncbi:MAG: DUF4064 domain-containing protein [Lactobacillales bacterium]|jgi:magnesium-transporting ATPase (P-type)|nr:DUF4064 domain-containing protein [Lactobacillales bacterium]
MKTPKILILIGNIIATILFGWSFINSVSGLLSDNSKLIEESTANISGLDANTVASITHTTLIIMSVFSIVALLLIWIAFVKFEQSKAWTIFLLVFAIISILPTYLVGSLLWIIGTIMQLTKKPEPQS